MDITCKFSPELLLQNGLKQALTDTEKVSTHYNLNSYHFFLANIILTFMVFKLSNIAVMYCPTDVLLHS